MKKLIRLIIVLAVLFGIVMFLKPIAVDLVHEISNMDLPDVSISNPLEDIQNIQNTSDPHPATNPDLNGPYDVVRVIDGDTAIIDIDGVETRVRFIGIDTPESVNPDESKNTEEGKAASNYTKQLLTGKQVYLEYDITREDTYGRTLAYIYMDDGVTMVEDELLKAGLATTLTIQPNSKYADHFYQLQVEAREAKAGFWETGFFG